MVQAIIDFGEKEERFLNIYKAEEGLKSKNDAINKILQEFEKYRKREKLAEEMRIILKEHETKYKKRRMTDDELDELLGL